MSVAAVVLAAGASRRLGSPKQLAMLGDETLLERAVRVAREAGCSPVIAVLGAEFEQVLRFGLSDDVVPVVNHEWEEGMGSSIRAGARACRSNVEGVVMMTCDQPAVTAEHLQLLITGSEIKASRYAGRNGVPAFFPAKYFDALMALTGIWGLGSCSRMLVMRSWRVGSWMWIRWRIWSRQGSCLGSPYRDSIVRRKRTSVAEPHYLRHADRAVIVGPKRVPQGLKPHCKCGIYGTTEVVPLSKIAFFRSV